MSRRLVILVWEEGEPLTIEYDGEFDLWEVQAALTQAQELINEDAQEDSEDGS